MQFGSQVAVRVQLTLVVLVAAKTRHHAIFLMHGKQEKTGMSDLRVTCYFRLTGYLLRLTMMSESRRVIGQPKTMRKGGKVVEDKIYFPGQSNKKMHFSFLTNPQVHFTVKQ